MSQSTLIPVADEIERFDIKDGLTWVLVIEKEVGAYACKKLT